MHYLCIDCGTQSAFGQEEREFVKSFDFSRLVSHLIFSPDIVCTPDLESNFHYGILKYKTLLPQQYNIGNGRQWPTNRYTPTLYYCVCPC